MSANAFGMSADYEQWKQSVDRPAVIESDWETLDQVEPVPVSFLFAGFIPFHQITLIEGRKGCGKSTLCAAIVAQLTGGPPLFGERKLKPGGKTLWLAGENSAEHLVRPSVEMAGGDSRLVVLPKKRKDGLGRHRILIPNDLPKLSKLVMWQDLECLVIDPYISMVAPGFSMRDEDSARAVLEPLAEWAAAHKVTPILTRHVRKGRGGDALDAGLGSAAVGNVAQSIIRLEPDRDNPPTMVLARVRGNYGSPPASLRYQLVADGAGRPRIEWLGRVPTDAESVLTPELEACDQEERSDALELLAFSLKDGPRAVRELRLEADNAGVSWRSMWRAKAKLGVKSERVATGMTHYNEWHLPSGAEQAPAEVAPAKKTRSRKKPR